MGNALTTFNITEENVLGIVVTYHPDTQFPERLKVIANQVGSILVVDNHSNETATSMLREVARDSRIGLVLNPGNLGIAKALNIGIARALSEGYKWVLLFDQDTLPGTDLLNGIRQAYEGFPAKERVAVIGANYIDASTGRPRRSPPKSKDAHWMERRTVITSGSLVSLNAYQKLGPFRDEYFIDGVDLEYCLRARANGFHVIMTREPLMVHDVGQTVLHQIAWKKTGTSNHSRLRRYYIMRNQIDITKKYLWKEPAWVFASSWTIFKSLILICIFEDGRLEKLKYSAIGLADGLRSHFDRQMA